MDPCCTSCRDHWETPIEILTPLPEEINQSDGVPCNLPLFDMTRTGDQYVGGSDRPASYSQHRIGNPTTTCQDNIENQIRNSGNEQKITSGNNINGTGENIAQASNGYIILRKYVQYLYYLGLGNYDTGAKSNQNFLQTIMFTVLTLLSLFQALTEIKIRTYGDARVDHVFGSVSIAYIFSYIVLLSLYTHANVTKASLIFNALKKLSTINIPVEFIRYQKLFSALPAALATISILDAMAKVLFSGIDLADWSPEWILLTKSYRLRRAFALWSNSSLQNETIDAYFQEQTENLTLSNIAIGGSSMCAEFAFYLHQNVFIHFFLLISLSLYLASSQLKFELKQKGLLELLKCNTRLDDEEEKSIWRTYEEVMELSHSIEQPFGTFFRGVHICLLLSFGHFFWITVYEYGAQTSVFYWLILLRLFFGVVAYWFAIKSARKHESFREWVAQNYHQKDVIVLEDKTIDKSSLLEDLSYHRIGIGSNLFYINDEFAFKFISVVASYFIFISDRASTK